MNGQVENQVGLVRERFFAPRLRVKNYDELNAWLMDQVLRYAKAHRHPEQRDRTIWEMISTEFEPSKVAQARKHLDPGGLADLIEIREGDALKTLAADLPEQVDLLLLDGAKPLYPDILDLVEGRLRAGSLIVADNADDSPDYLQAGARAWERIPVRPLRGGRRTVDAPRLTCKQPLNSPASASRCRSGLIGFLS
jgi:hypothetical protein